MPRREAVESEHTMTMPTGVLAPASTKSITFGVVSFLNARPLREFIPQREDVIVRPEVPSKLIDLLNAGQCDVALLPVVDYWRNRDRLESVSDACIGSDGETMTVRVYSKKPPDRIERLYVDGDSHTSVVLARLVWLELYGHKLDVVPLRDMRIDLDGPAEAVMLIGDKVVTNAPRGFGFEVDLGAAWKHLTNLPFVFAAWYGRRGERHLSAARMLNEARDRGVADVRRIAMDAAPLHGWPPELAVRYLGETMKYRVTSAMRAGMDRFFYMAENHGLFA